MGVPGRVAPGGPEQDVKQIFPLFAIRDVSLDQGPVVIEAPPQICGRKICTDVREEYPAIPGVPLADFVDVFQEPVDGHVRTEANAVVECTIRQLGLNERPDNPVEMILDILPPHQAGVDLPPPGLRLQE